MYWPKLIFAGLMALPLAAQTNIAISSTVVQSNVKPAGINIGQPVTYGSFQLLKNLIAYTPGFQDSAYESAIQCTTGTSSTGCVIYNNYFPSGFWVTGSSITVLTGTAAGCTTTVSSFSGSLLSFSSACAISVNDTIAVTKQITSANAGANYLPANGWSITASAGGALTASSSAPPASNGSTYVRSVNLSTSTTGDYVYLTYTFDNQYVPALGTTKSFIDLNGNYSMTYWAKAATNGQQLFVKVARGATSYLTATDTLTTSWAQYTHSFTPSETGDQSANGAMTAGFATVGQESINVSKVFVGEASGDPNGFRSSVVTLLQNAKFGSLRFWDGETLTGPLANLLVDQWAQEPYGSLSSISSEGSGVGYNRGVSYSYPMALSLCQAVGNTECWLVLPVTMTTSEAAYLIQYLAGGAGTTGGAYRISQGYTSTWTSVIPKIHLEFGNEAWNGSFAGGSFELNYANYGTLADGVFAAMKADSSYDSTHISLVLDGQSSYQSLTQSAQLTCSHNDELDVGPYTNQNISDNTFSDVWSATLAEPQVFWQTGAASGSGQVCAEYTGGTLCPSQGYFNSGSGTASQYGGQMYLNKLLAGYGYSGTAKILSVYEQNFSTTGTSGAGSSGGFTQAQMNQFFNANGAGLATAEQILTNLANGVKTQNLFQLPQYYYIIPTMSAGATYFYGWGSVVDIGGPTNLQRPQLVAESAVNAVIPFGGSELQTTQTSTPTFSVGNTSTSATINTVASASVNTVLSYAFTNGTSYSLVLLNLDQTSTHAVTFSGANAPTGTVTVAVVNSTNLTDNNETSANYAATTSTLSSPTSYTLPAHSLVTMSWGGSGSTITCASTVAAGATVTCTASTAPTVMSLATGSVGTLTTTSSTTATYTAPAGIVAQNQLIGCQVLPPDSIFNTPINNLSVGTYSSAQITTAASYSGVYELFVFQPGWGISKANATTPVVSSKDYNNSATSTYPEPSGSSLLREGGNWAGVSGFEANGFGPPDHHTMTVQYQTSTSYPACTFFETYNDYLNGALRQCHGTASQTCTQQGQGNYSSTSYAVISPSGTDAAGLPLASLTAHADEIINNTLNHMQRVTMGTFQFWTAFGNVFHWPATAATGGTTCGTLASNGDCEDHMGLGSILRLKSGFSSSGTCGTANTTSCSIASICASPLTATQITYCQNYLATWQKYGLIVADTGTENALTPSLDVFQNADLIAVFNHIQAAGITLKNFDVVDASPLLQSPATYEVTPNGQASYAGTYGGITYSSVTQSATTPANQAVVTCSGCNLQYIAIQPVLIGTILPLVGAGVPTGGTQSLASPVAWVTPSTASQSITWSVVGTGCGTVSGSTYTAPGSASNEASCDLHGVAAADSAATIDIRFTLIPASSGNIRIDTGSSTATTDGNGNSWYPDIYATAYEATNTDTAAQWGGGTFATQYSTWAYVGGPNDFRYYLWGVPNGNYKVHLLFGLSNYFCTYPCGSWPGANYGIHSWTTDHIEAQNAIQLHSFDWGYPAGYVRSTPTDAFVPAIVSNNILTVGVLPVSPDVAYAASDPWTTSYTGPNFAPDAVSNGIKYNSLTGMEVLGDSTAAHLAIDITSQACSTYPSTAGCASGNTCSSVAILPTQVCAGQTLQPIYALPWYYSPAGSPTWSILQDPWKGTSSIVTNADGSVTITAGSGAILNNQPLTVQATWGGYSATAIFYSVGSKTPIL